MQLREQGLSTGQSLKSLLRIYSQVQLATLVNRPPEGVGWLHEIKFDGYRLLAFLSNSNAFLRTRNGKDWTSKFPSLVGSLKNLKAVDAVLDLEAVVLDEKGKSNFQKFQAALGEGGNTASIVGYVFDLLYVNGRDLMDLPLHERKKGSLNC